MGISLSLRVERIQTTARTDMQMDLQELRHVYEESKRHIAVLNQCLNELTHRLQQAHLYDNEAEFHYLKFKMTMMQAVRDMYQIYHDSKWKQLQTECTLSLQEILYGDSSDFSDGNHSDDPLTSTPTHSRIEEDLHIHEIPVAISPITDPDITGIPMSWSSSFHSFLGGMLEDELLERDM